MSILFAAVLVPAANAELVSFAGVRDSSLPVDQYLSGSYTYTQSQLLLSTATATTAIVTGTARARTEYGVNRAAAENNTPVDDEALRQSSIGGPFSIGISAWSDRFTISGGSGTGRIDVSAVLTGQFGPKPDPSYGGGGAYFLFVATPAQIAELRTKPFEFLNAFIEAYEQDSSVATLALLQNVLTPGFVDPGTAVPPGSAFGGVLSGSIAFTFAEPFYLVGLLAAFANDFGILDAFNTARFGIGAVAGANILSESGTEYPAAVPEPSTYVVFAIGLAVLAFFGRQRSPSRRGQRGGPY